MAFDFFSLMFWITFIGVAAMLLAKYESARILKNTDERLAAITRELKRRATPAE